jgi:hypothetical protein
MVCRGCGEDKELIDAHIIPKWVYRDLKRNEDHLLVIEAGAERPLKSRIGDYDPTILCADCDQHLGIFDDYGKHVLVDKQPEWETIIRRGELVAWSLTGINPSRLEKFLLSILWRGSISQRPFFSGVRLGPHEDSLRDYLWSDQQAHKHFGCVLAKFSKSKVVAHLEKTPRSPGLVKKINGRNYYKLYLAGFVAFIRVDKRPPTPPFASYELSNRPEGAVIRIQFDGSSEFHEIWESV